MDQYTTSIKPTFCPGCGNYNIMEAIKSALIELRLPPHEVVITYDVGCNANMADFVKTYAFHGLHGRSVPAAAGIKLANHHLTVIALIGDGGFYGEGGQHFLSLMRGNHDITVLVNDNERYSLTTGQFSPTTPKGTVTVSTPEGAIEEPLNPLAVALVNHATFVGRGFAGETNHLKELIIKAINHKGFSLIDILQPCVIWNRQKTYDWYRERIYELEKPLSRREALDKALEKEKLAIGLFYQEKKKAYHEAVSSLQDKPLVNQSIETININNLLEEVS